MRQRLSWDEGKVAEITKKAADPNTMNREDRDELHEDRNRKYQNGDPSSWAEDQDHAHRWEGEGRTETGHPAPQSAAPAAAPAVAAPAPAMDAPEAPAREAIIQARKLEDKALKCITIAQRMLPGAEDSAIEDQATELMFLPERAVMATLQRQSELAVKIAAAAEEVKEEKPVVEEKEVKEEKPVEAKEEVKEEKPVVEEEEVKEEKPVEASEKDLLDILFDSADPVPEVKVAKTGAKKLSGLVKQASRSEDPLAGLWVTPPDVSEAFK